VYQRLVLKYQDQSFSISFILLIKSYRNTIYFPGPLAVFATVGAGVEVRRL
jgi:hypothetical protein